MGVAVVGGRCRRPERIAVVLRLDFGSALSRTVIVMANVDMSIHFALRNVIGCITYPRHASVRDVERKDERQEAGKEFSHRPVDSNATGDAV